MEKEKVIEKLKKFIEEGEKILLIIKKAPTFYVPDMYREWRREVKMFLERNVNKGVADEFESLDIGWTTSETVKEKLAILKVQVKTIVEYDNELSDDDVFKMNKNKKLINDEKIFIVHGHDDKMKLDVEKCISDLKYKPIILSQQASKNKTIIEKFEEYSDTLYAIVLLSGDDEGKQKNEINHKLRARQNVIFELGFFIGKLGREKIFVLKSGEVEIPSDYAGVVYHDYDSSNNSWKLELVKELKAVGLNADANDLC